RTSPVTASDGMSSPVRVVKTRPNVTPVPVRRLRAISPSAPMATRSGHAITRSRSGRPIDSPAAMRSSSSARGWTTVIVQISPYAPEAPRRLPPGLKSRCSDCGVSPVTGAEAPALHGCADGVGDTGGQGERVATGLPRDAGLTPRANRVDETRELTPQRFVLLDGHRSALYARPSLLGPPQPPDLEPACAGVHRDVHVRLETSHLPHRIL